MSAQFWRLENPDYDGDYRHSYVNGSVIHPYGLPGINCDACGATWGGSRVLPFTCPLSLRTHPNLIESWPVSVLEHKEIQRHVREEFAKEEVTLPDLKPGDEFQPCYLEIPSKPQADFLWSGLEGPLVSARIKQLFETLQIQDIVFCEVIPRRVGTRNAKHPPPMPRTGEPEDIIDEVILSKHPEEAGPYYEMVIFSESHYPPGGAPTSICPACGYKSIDDRKRKLVMLPTMWRGHDIFYLATTLFILVTNRVQQALRDIGATNIQLKLFSKP